MTAESTRPGRTTRDPEAHRIYINYIVKNARYANGTEQPDEGDSIVVRNIPRIQPPAARTISSDGAFNVQDAPRVLRNRYLLSFRLRDEKHRRRDRSLVVIGKPIRVALRVARHARVDLAIDVRRRARRRCERLQRGNAD